MSEFYIGQKVVCVDDSGGVWSLKKDMIYTVIATEQSPCCNFQIIDVGIKCYSKFHMYCGRCNYKHYTLNNSVTFRSSRFVPLDEYYANEVAVNEMIQSETIKL